MQSSLGTRAPRFRPAVRIVVYLLLQAVALTLLILAGKLFQKGFDIVRGSMAHSAFALVQYAGLIALVIAGARLAHTYLSRLPFHCFGLSREPGWVRELSVGLGLGAFFPTLIAAVGLATGLASFVPRAVPTVSFALGLAKLLGVAIFEETLFRGYVFQELGRWKGAPVAALAAFTAFGGLHLQNPGGNLQGAFATGLAGAALYATYAATQRLWMAIGFHFAWNTSLSLVIGFSNGGRFFDERLFDAQLRGPSMLSGGTFGPEASVAAMMAFIALGGIAWYLRPRAPRSA